MQDDLPNIIPVDSSYYEEVSNPIIHFPTLNVAENLSVDMVIGYDILQRYNAKINVFKNYLYL